MPQDEDTGLVARIAQALSTIVVTAAIAAVTAAAIATIAITTAVSRPPLLPSPNHRCRCPVAAVVAAATRAAYLAAVYLAAATFRSAAAVAVIYVIAVAAASLRSLLTPWPCLLRSLPPP